MASDVGVGDATIASLLVQPADNTTQVALIVTAPDGSTQPITMTGGAFTPVDGSDDQQQTWTATTPLIYTQAGRWILHYTVTGTGQGTEDAAVGVVPSPTAGGPTWTPGRSRVANYVPHRTLAVNQASVVTSDDTYEMTFDSTTIPSGVQVDRLIADGVDWISAVLAPLNTVSQPAAAVLVALWAAVAVERSWPQDDQALPRADAMEKQMDTLLTAIEKSNTQANEQAGISYPVILPQWSFPRPDRRWDDPRFW